MAKKISDLVAATQLGDNDSFVFNDVLAGNDKRVTASSLRADADVVKVETVADLRNLEGKRDEQIVELLGYYAVNDDGGGPVFWDSTSTEADNGKTIFSVTGVTTGRWKRLLKNVVNTKQLGAKADGIADEGEILEFAYSNFKRVILSEGRYLSNTTRNLSISDTEIIGDGNVEIFENTNGRIYNLQNLNNVTFRNITFNSELSSTTSNSFGLVSSVQGITEEVDFINCSFTAPNVGVNGYKGIHEQSTGITANNVRFTDCSFSSLGRMGIEYQNHNFTDANYSIQNITIRNCFFNSCGTVASFGMAVSISGICKDVIINGNIVDNCGLGIEVVSCRETIVSSNIIKNVSGASISYTGNSTEIAGRESDSHIISSNIIINSGNLRIYNVTNSLIKGNVINGASYITTRDVYRNVFSENRINTTGAYGIYIESSDDGSEKNLIISNYINGTTASCLRFNELGTKNNFATGNIFLRRNSSGSRWDQINGASSNIVKLYIQDPWFLKNDTSGYSSSFSSSSIFNLGNYNLWVDSTGDLRIKNGTPTSDTDGTVVGSQT